MASSKPIDHPSRAPLAICTERLYLRPVEPTDAAGTAALVTEDVARSLSTWPSPMTAEEALEKIEASMERFVSSTALDLAIIRRRDSQLVGWIGFLAESESIRIAYWLGRDFRGRGIATEAGQHAIPVAAHFLGANTFHALVLKTNAASIRVLSRLGFVLLGEELVTMQTRDSLEECFRFGLFLDGQNEDAGRS